MAKSSSAVKDAWNQRNYETFLLRIKKGDKAKLQAQAAEAGCSVNRLICDCINARFPGLLAVLDDSSKKKRS